MIELLNDRDDENELSLLTYILIIMFGTLFALFVYYILKSFVESEYFRIIDVVRTRFVK